MSGTIVVFAYAGGGDGNKDKYTVPGFPGTWPRNLARSQMEETMTNKDRYCVSGTPDDQSMLTHKPIDVRPRTPFSFPIFIVIISFIAMLVAALSYIFNFQFVSDYTTQFKNLQFGHRILTEEIGSEALSEGDKSFYWLFIQTCVFYVSIIYAMNIMRKFLTRLELIDNISLRNKSDVQYYALFIIPMVNVAWFFISFCSLAVVTDNILCIELNISKAKNNIGKFFAIGFSLLFAGGILLWPRFFHLGSTSSVFIVLLFGLHFILYDFGTMVHYYLYSFSILLTALCVHFIVAGHHFYIVDFFPYGVFLLIFSNIMLLSFSVVSMILISKHYINFTAGCRI